MARSATLLIYAAFLLAAARAIQDSSPKGRALMRNEGDHAGLTDLGRGGGSSAGLFEFTEEDEVEQAEDDRRSGTDEGDALTSLASGGLDSTAEEGEEDLQGDKDKKKDKAGNGAASKNSKKSAKDTKSKKSGKDKGGKNAPSMGAKKTGKPSKQNKAGGGSKKSGKDKGGSGAPRMSAKKTGKPSKQNKAGDGGYGYSAPSEGEEEEVAQEDAGDMGTGTGGKGGKSGSMGTGTGGKGGKSGSMGTGTGGKGGKSGKTEETATPPAPPPPPPPAATTSNAPYSTTVA